MLALLLILQLFSAVFAVHLPAALTGLRRYFMLAVFFVMVRTLAVTQKDRLTVLRVMFYAGFVPAFISLVQFFSPAYEFVRHGGIRATGSTSDPTINAMFMISALLASFIPWRSEHEKPVMAARAILVVAVGVSLSRTGYVVLAVAMIAMLWKKRKTPFVHNAAIAVLISVMMIAALLVFSGRVNWDAFRTVGINNLRNPSVKMRWDKTRAAVAMMNRHPLTGVGVNNFKSEFPVYMPVDAICRSTVAHNMYLDISSESGIPGAVMLLIWVVILSKRSRHALAADQPDAAALSVLLLAWAVAGLSYSMHHEKILWLVMAMAGQGSWRGFREKNVKHANVQVQTIKNY